MIISKNFNARRRNMSTRNDASKEEADREFVLTRVFDAPAALVFKAWTDPKQMAHWWGPHTFTNPVCEMDVRPGGAYRIVMRSPDGVEYPMKGFFREVVESRRLVFTNDLSEHPDEWHNMIDPNRLKGKGKPAVDAITTVTFDEHQGKTTLTIHMCFESAATRDAHVRHGMADGWSQSLERLDQLLATSTSDREIVITRDFDAPRELVWQAMTDPQRVIHWWGPRGFTTTIEQMDVRPGGVWKQVMHGPDGTDYPNKHIFKEVVKPERLVYSHGGGKKGSPSVQCEATWTFDALDAGKTRVMIHMVFASAADRDTVVKEYGAIEGGRQTLGRLAEFLAKG
jgi:uncharacterized protein YndB with AHSA1/START domain